MSISEEAKIKLTNDQHEFIELLGTLRGEKIYTAAFTIAVYDKIFNMIYNNTLNCDYLSELILCNTEHPIVNSLTADYVAVDKNTDFNNLEKFITDKIKELCPQ